MTGEFIEVLNQISKEKEIPLDTLIETVESALATAYKKNYPASADIQVRIDANKLSLTPFKIFSLKTVVESVDNPNAEMTLEEAKLIDPDVVIGESVEVNINPGNFGRIAAQTAKQVVVQRIREAERRRVFDEYNEKIGEVVVGVVGRREGKTITVNLGKLEAVLPVQEQVESEPYHFNDRIKVYVLEVRETQKGPQVVVSRTHPSLIRRLFELEVPEIGDGIVTIKSVAREPGARSKIAVYSRDEKVDPVGACVGHRGSRVQAIVTELYDEKIDIVRWSENASDFIAEALSPAKSVKATINEDAKSAFVVVPDNQLSLAIGKAGQNVRLAARLTNWRIDIRSEAQVARAALMSVTDDEEGENGAEIAQAPATRAEATAGLLPDLGREPAQSKPKKKIGAKALLASIGDDSDVEEDDEALEDDVNPDETSAKDDE